MSIEFEAKIRKLNNMSYRILVPLKVIKQSGLKAGQTVIAVLSVVPDEVTTETIKNENEPMPPQL